MPGFGSPELATQAYNVKDYGALGNGSADDTTAIQNTINACISAGGGIIYAPPGTYKISATLTFVGGVEANLSFIFQGAGGRATTILQSNLSADVFASSPYPTGSALSGCAFRDFGINFTGTPTAGSVFNFPWVGTTEITMILVLQCWTFTSLGQAGTTTTVGNVWVHKNTVNGVNGTCYQFYGQGGNVFLEDSELFGIGNATACVCLGWNNSYYDTFWMRGLDFEGFGAGLNFSVNGSSQCGINDAYIEDTIIDGVENYGLLISAGSAAASIWRMKCRNLWITTSGGSTPCLVIGSSNSGYLQDLSFSGCNFSGTQVGVTINGAAGTIPSDIAFDFCQIYQSPIAISLAYTNNVSFLNSSIGVPYGGGATSLLQTANTNTGLLFRGNRIANYATILGGSGLSSIGSGSLIADNLGLNPYGSLTAPTYTAGTPSTNSFPFSVRVSVTGASAVAINGAATGGGVGAYILLPGETITPTGAGSWTWYGL